METLLLDTDTVERHTPMLAVVEAVEDAFAAHAEGDVVMPAKTYVDLPADDGDFRAMPAYVDAGDWRGAGCKWVNVHPHNRERFALPTVMATMVLSDPANGFPTAILDGTPLTATRTGAAAAVATDYLAAEDADSFGVVGAGVQASTQLAAVASVRDVSEVVVADRDPERAAAFVDAHAEAFDARAGSIADAGHCDVCSTVTPVEEPVVGPDDLGPETHVNAIGADAPGKHELADEILTAAKIVVDDREQATHSGEINVPYAAGVLADADVHATVGEVVTGRADGRVGADGVTVFDSTGLAIQDVAAARVAVERARAAGDGAATGLLSV